jgi:hypothetical protein
MQCTMLAQCAAVFGDVSLSLRVMLGLRVTVCLFTFLSFITLSSCFFFKEIPLFTWRAWHAGYPIAIFFLDTVKNKAFNRLEEIGSGK